MTILFPEWIIRENDRFIVEQDREVPIRWFSIIKPTRKINGIDSFTDNEAEEFIKITRKIRKWMREKLLIDDVYLFQNEDSRHNFHLRLFPRHPWMKEFWIKIESVREIMNHATLYRTDKQYIDDVETGIDIMRKRMEEYSPNKKK